jgi:hypothetical protein
MDRIGPYDVLEFVGRGGIGRVYRALHRDTGAEVALKLLHPSHRGDALVRRLVINEAIAAGRLSHANVVALLDGGLDESGAPFLVTELVRGPQLTSWIARWPGLASVAPVLDGLLAGLCEAHANGIVHRDLKPENVLVDARDPGALVAKIADFGIARLLDPVDEGPAPQGAGTRAYMAPEQIAPDMPSGPWTDLYAVGAILKELLSGAAGKGPLRGRPGLELPRGLVKLVAALTSAEPHARPRFASSVRSELAELLARVREREVARVETVEPMRVGAPTVEIEPRDSDVRALVARPAITSLPVWRLRDPPLVGRERERDLLTDLAERVATRGGSRVLLLRGPPGIGKSRIARLGVATVERAALMGSVSTGYDADADDTAGGLRREIARVIGVPPLEVDGSIPQRWRWLARLDASLDLVTLARWLRGGTTDPPVERLAAVVHSLLVALSRVRPVYLWLDDVVWARDGAWELLERIAARPREGAILAVATIRTPLERVSVERARELRAISRLRSVSSRNVAPLSLRDARDLAARTARERGSSVDDAAIRASSGRPLAVVERAISPDGPFVARRIDELVACLGQGAGEALRVLSAAAILGGRFEDRVLRSAMGEVDRVLDLALLGGLLRVERANTYRFEHAVYRDELLDRLSARADEDELHLAVARALVNVYGDERADVAARSAILLWRGGDRSAAWHWLLHAATMNARAGDREAAAARLELAAGWLRADRAPRDDERRARLLYTRANALYFESAYDESLAGVRRAAKMAERLGLSDLLADCRALEANVCFYMGAHDEAERLARACAAYVAEHEQGREVLGFIDAPSARRAGAGPRRSRRVQALSRREPALRGRDTDELAPRHLRRQPRGSRPRARRRRGREGARPRAPARGARDQRRQPARRDHRRVRARRALLGQRRGRAAPARAPREAARDPRRRVASVVAPHPRGARVRRARSSLAGEPPHRRAPSRVRRLGDRRRVLGARARSPRAFARGARPASAAPPRAPARGRAQPLARSTVTSLLAVTRRELSEVHAAQAGAPRRFAHVAAGLREDPHQVLPLEVLDPARLRLVERAIDLDRRKVAPVSELDARAAEDRDALHEVPELAHVPGPEIADPLRERGVERGFGGLVVGRDLGEQQRGEERDVREAIAQRGHLQRGDEQPVQEVLTEAAFVDHALERAVRRRDHAYVDLDLLLCAEPPHAAGVDRAEELRLHLDRELADLVEEERASMRALERAGLLAGGAGVRAAHVTEELVVRERLSHGGAVDDDERSVAPRARAMDLSRDELLAGARLAANQHAHVGLRDALHRGEELMRDGRGAGERSEAVAAVPRELAERRVGGARFERRASEPDARAGHEPRLADAALADPRAVLAPEVAHAHALRSAQHLDVEARHARVLQAQIGGDAGADRGAAALEREHESAIGTFDDAKRAHATDRLAGVRRGGARRVDDDLLHSVMAGHPLRSTG